MIAGKVRTLEQIRLKTDWLSVLGSTSASRKSRSSALENTHFRNSSLNLGLSERQLTVMQLEDNSQAGAVTGRAVTMLQAASKSYCRDFVVQAHSVGCCFSLFRISIALRNFPILIFFPCSCNKNSIWAPLVQEIELFFQPLAGSPRCRRAGGGRSGEGDAPAAGDGRAGLQESSALGQHPIAWAGEQLRATT